MCLLKTIRTAVRELLTDRCAECGVVLTDKNRQNFPYDGICADCVWKK